MQSTIMLSNGRMFGSVPHRTTNRLAAILFIIIGLNGTVTSARAAHPDGDAPGLQVLTRGPVHEAFAGMVAYDTEPGLVVAKTPPDPIEENPPEDRPEGDNVAWIPGYWAWDDERDDFIWISGTWRALPPGHEWLSGYWTETSQGHQWISGYWADVTATETTYYPAPPRTLETGPNFAAPSADYGWTPGCWIWQQGRYAWRPGYWTQGRADWDWIPAHYVWTPRGFIFVDGYWDYSVERRGLLFAPVYFERGVSSRRGYRYSPTIVISLSVFSQHLFLRPRYQHYYFGDYYAEDYQRDGIYASFSFQSSRRGYDPFYSRERWANRTDRDWEHRQAAAYQNHREHEFTRPPRTWAAQLSIGATPVGSTRERPPVALSIQQLTGRKDKQVRFRPVAQEERQQLDRRGGEIQHLREQRRTTEASRVNSSVQQSPAALEPAQVRRPRSPVVAKPTQTSDRKLTPPKVPPAPQPDPKFPRQAPASGRHPDANRSDPPPRQPEAKKSPAPTRNLAPPSTQPARSESVQLPRTPDTKVRNKPALDDRKVDQPTRLDSSPATKAGTVNTRQTRPKAEQKALERQEKARQAEEREQKAKALRQAEIEKRKADAAEQKKRKPSGKSEKKHPVPKKQKADNPPEESAGQEKTKPAPAEESPPS